MGSLTGQEYTHVVIGIVHNNNHEVLVSRRKKNTHLPGMLEFPGGKTEDNELAFDTLKREFKEELGIHVLRAAPLIQIPFHYTDRCLLLDVFNIQEYSGKVSANEGQELFWQSIESLSDIGFPAANFGIIRALRFPKHFPITPDCLEEKSFLNHFENVISRNDSKIIQLRAHALSNSAYSKLAMQCFDLCNQYKTKLVLNRELECIENLNFSGLHLTSKNLLKLEKRPLGANHIIGASCHDVKEVEKANTLKLDYIYIGPVLDKAENRKAKTLGWDGFARLSRMSTVPAYAIGGMDPSKLDKCFLSGGQGIAAIRAFWK